MHAGFVAEFCSLGGNVVDRYWLDVLAEDVPEKLSTVRLDGPDGFFLAMDTSIGTFLQRYAERHARLAEHVVAGAFGSAPVLLDPAVVEKLGDRLIGLVTASFVPLDSSRPDWNAYVVEYETEFPELGETAASVYHLFDIDYVNSMEAVMRAMESVDGDISNRDRFLEALSEVQLDAPNGLIELDDRLQAMVRSTCLGSRRMSRGTSSSAPSRRSRGSTRPTGEPSGWNRRHRTEHNRRANGGPRRRGRRAANPRRGRPTR